MTDDEYEGAEWTDETRRRFAAAVERTAEAVRRHGAAVLAATGPGELPQVFDAGAELGGVLVAYEDAHLDLTGAPLPFDVLDMDDEDEDVDDEDDAGPEPEPVATVRVLHGADHDVTDPAAVLDAGRAAYRQVWPDDPEDAAAADVTTLGRAVYQVWHAAGLTALDGVPGLRPTGSTTWVLDVTAAGPVTADRVLFRFDEAYGPGDGPDPGLDEDPAEWARRQVGG